MPKSRTHAKRRLKKSAKNKQRAKRTLRKQAESNEQVEQAKPAQAEEPREKFTIDDLAGRA